MDVEKIRALRLADPFKPFKLVMSDGRVLPVERAVFLGIAPDGRRLAYAMAEGGFDFLPVESVADAVIDEQMLWHWRAR
ncbi:MAG: hypothetical protein JWL69_2866 [Phycisphaerales bacterium]|nr:hypothetical protein [Phycisphaerales bacterium]MDB5357829.1 hypothetical protein [Phycisphaerales bacterium]